MYILLAQLLLFTFYICFVWYKVGIQKSISESWYKLSPSYNWMFTVIMCFGIGILQLMHNSTFFFFSGAFLCFTGAASDYKNWKTSKIVHYVGAVGGILFSIVALWQNHVEWVMSPILLTILFCWQFKIPNRIWWIEVVAFYSIMAGLFEMYKYQ